MNSPHVRSMQVWAVLFWKGYFADLEDLGVGMLGDLANLAGFFLNSAGQLPQQKKYRRPL